MTAPVLLLRRDPAQGMARFYAMRVEPDLLGGWLLVCEWGRIGSPGRVRTTSYPDEAAAAAAMARLERSKRRRGYAASSAMR